MSQLVKKRGPSNYTDAQITEGLTVLALCSGNVRKAGEQVGIPAATLRHWMGRTHAEDYRRIEQKELPRVYGEIARRCEALALTESEIEEELAITLRAQIPEMKPGEVATALRNMAVSKAVNVDKASLVRGRPTAITERRDAMEMVRALASRFGSVVAPVDAEAVEVTDA